MPLNPQVGSLMNCLKNNEKQMSSINRSFLNKLDQTRVHVQMEMTIIKRCISPSNLFQQKGTLKLKPMITLTNCLTLINPKIVRLMFGTLNSNYKNVLLANVINKYPI